MKNRILVGLIIAAALLTLVAALFVVSVFSNQASGFKGGVSIFALVAALTALFTTILSYRRLNRKPPS